MRLTVAVAFLAGLVACAATEELDDPAQALIARSHAAHESVTRLDRDNAPTIHAQDALAGHLDKRGALHDAWNKLRGKPAVKPADEKADKKGKTAEGPDGKSTAWFVGKSEGKPRPKPAPQDNSVISMPGPHILHGHEATGIHVWELGDDLVVGSPTKPGNNAAPSENLMKIGLGREGRPAFDRPKGKLLKNVAAKVDRQPYVYRAGEQLNYKGKLGSHWNRGLVWKKADELAKNKVVDRRNFNPKIFKDKLLEELNPRAEVDYWSTIGRRV